VRKRTLLRQASLVRARRYGLRRMVNDYVALYQSLLASNSSGVPTPSVEVPA
jgi:hypothetical protein